MITEGQKNRDLAPLVDRFGRLHTYLRVSVTERCNLRCVYCMPAHGVDLKPRHEILTFEEIARLARVMARMGVNKIRLTGGEPLVRRDLHLLVAELARIPGIRTLAMTTNGVLLAEKAGLLREAGLSHLNISLDTLRAERFEKIALRQHFEGTMAGIRAAMAGGFESVKLNCVVMGGINDDEALDFIEFAREMPTEIRFIEFMPFKDNQWGRGELVPWRELRARIERRWELTPLAGEASDVAKSFAVKGAACRVSFITSMTEDFCAGCNRVRLLCDGSIKSCLFTPPEKNLREMLRDGSDDLQLAAAIRACIGMKHEKHAPMDELMRMDNNPMVEIGG